MALGALGQVSLADGQNSGLDVTDNVVLCLQSGWIANPNRPCWSDFRSWHTCFPNSEHQRGKNEVKDCPERSAKPRGRPMLGLGCRAPSPSFSPGFLRQDALQPDHLIREHGLHLLRLCVHLHKHLLLQGLNLCGTLRMVVIDSGLQGRLGPR